MHRSFIPLLAGALLLPSLASAQKAPPPSSAFNLHSSPVQVLDANELVCVITSSPEHCVDVFTSATSHGLSWPRGTINGYMYSGGPQVTGIVRRDPGCVDPKAELSRSPGCFAWSGDTTGAFFYEQSGIRYHGSPVTEIYSSTSAEDRADWPRAGFLADFPWADAAVPDSAGFDTSLIGRVAASEQDTWSAYWDGDPSRSPSSRPHPLGIFVEQRTLAWNHPTGNEATIYFMFRVRNVTNHPMFQRLSEEQVFAGADRLPDTGWALDSLYFTYSWDPDVTTDATLNYLTVIPPLDMMLAYKDNFRSFDFTYPPAQFRSPFATNTPGLVAISFIETPGDRGMTSASVLTGGGAFVHPSTVQRAWRYASLNLDPRAGDPFCFLPMDRVRRGRMCYPAQTPADVKGYMTTGPFSLEPGQTETVIVAITVAATVETPLILSGTDNKPGFPTPAPGCNNEPVRPIEVAAGWLSGACPADSFATTDRSTIRAVPGSLVHKVLVAKEVAARGFLLGGAPEAPPFYLVPGNGRITVVWEPSATETAGDAFADAAGDPDSPVYDPNHRRNDVEGYRIYRGTRPDDLRVIAQFDRRDTRWRDTLCITDADHVTGLPCTDEHDVPLSGSVVQYTAVTNTAGGQRLVVEADTAFAARPLEDTGVPFSFIDTTVRNGVPYYYRVVAFDFNSIRSGPSSLESASAVKSTQARTDATSLTAADVDVGLFGRTRALATAPHPVIDPVTGTFAAPQPPTAQFTGSFTELAGQLLAAGARDVRIDSVLPGYYPNGVIATYHISVDGAPSTVVFTNRTSQAAPGTTETVELPVLALDADPVARAALQARGVDAPPVGGQLTTSLTVDRPHWNSLHANWAFKQPGFWYSTISDPPETWPGGSRWFSGEAPSLADPTLGPAAHGGLDGITRIFQPTPYRGLRFGDDRSTATPMAAYAGLSEQVFRRFYGTVLGVTRGADVQLHWGTAELDSVIDITHDVTVPFSTAVRASYGFLADSDGDGTLTYGDFYHLRGLEAAPANEITRFALNAVPLRAQPVVMQVDATGDLVADGTGFGLYINGEPYIFEGPVPSHSVWTLRTYNGAVTLQAGRYAFTPTGGNPAVPGLRFVAAVTEPARIVAAAADVSRVHTVPDPYYANSLFDRSGTSKRLQFVNVPADATIRIYTLSGVLVTVLTHSDAAGGGEVSWNLLGRGNNEVASGVYLFHVATPDGRSHVGRFTLVNAR